MSIRWLLWSLLSPSQLILFSIAVGIALFALGRMRPARILLLAGGAALVVFGLLPTSIYLANLLETRFPQPVLPDRVDGIVLLAGAETPAASQAYGEPQVGARGSRYVTLLRLADRIVVQLTPDAAVRREAALKEIAKATKRKPGQKI